MEILDVTSDARQKQTVFLDDGTSFNLEMYFCAMQLGWFIVNLTYGNFVIKNLRITTSPNILHQFRNQIPFGLACATSSNQEASQVLDFSSGFAILYLLNAAEVKQYAEFLSE